MTATGDQTTGRRALPDVPVAGVVVAAVLGLLAIWVQHLVTAYDEPFWGLFDNQLDLDVYRAGAQTVLDGGRLYEAKLLGQMDYTYAPVSVLVFMPFAAVPFLVARIVWSVLIFAALYWVITMSFRALGRDITWRLRTVAVAIVLVSTLLEPVRSTIWFGQVNIFLMAIVLWDLLRPSGSRLQGIGAGVAAGIKLTPLVFTLYLLVTRRSRAAVLSVVGFVGTIALAFAVMPRDSWQYWTGTFLDSDRVGVPDTVGNQSLRGLIANLGRTEHPSTLLWVVLAGLVAVLGFGAARRAHRGGRELLAITLVGMTSCAVSPMSWGHHWVWLVPLLVIGVHHLLNGSRLVATAAGIGLIAMVLAAFAWRTRIDGVMTFVGVEHPYALYTGLFFKNGIDTLRWFTLAPYLWILVVTAVLTLVLVRRAVPGDATGSTDPVVSASGSPAR
ncbi:glycosyltransferase 87 family protein [uncultured Williamsia sp.]|uniref:glycosyltransferase 87 family protein n=1 Tax=uncultured Williamsia sp. TaxID=259311 RepID=UPI00261E1E95|nr:glycosyltransferase 87 family protein [uncultured Williamsia sp.]